MVALSRAPRSPISKAEITAVEVFFINIHDQVRRQVAFMID